MRILMNRILLAAPKSGSGKTMITCGIITLLKERGLKVSAMKSGPDYIDPMFHRRVLGVPSGNLDTFFTDDDTARYLLAKRSEGTDITVIEGVMGFYDGLGGVDTKASAYDIARVTRTPVILVLDAKGASLTLAAQIKGIKEFKEDSNVKGVILNRVSPMIYERLKGVIEDECGVKLMGYVPEIKDLEVPSRHLGLVTPEEVSSFKEWNAALTNAMKEGIDLDALIELSEEAPDIEYKVPDIPKPDSSAGKVRVGVAYDEAFSFYYTENFDLMKEMGAEIITFSPLKDKSIPDGVGALIFGGGYPEIYARELAENKEMKESVRDAIKAGMPCIAECGGFMYISSSLTDENGDTFDMTGILEGRAADSKRLGRFGYIEAEALKDGLLCKKGERIRGHEFHYWDTDMNGEDFVARKPVGARSWKCMYHTETLAAGFPHFYFYNAPHMLCNFLEKAREYSRESGR